MRNSFLFAFIWLFCFLCNSYAVGNVLKEKYSYAVLTAGGNGILNARDLNDGLKPAPFSTKEPTGHIYWQCFLREDVHIAIEDIGYSTYDLADNDADLTITAYSKSGILHKYVMRRNWATSGTEKRFNQILKVMSGEKYVCLSGEFGFIEEEVIHGRKQLTYFWTSERIKTKKGCSSYFKSVDCQ
ncbi:MAG TPA: hypothetical protein VNC84_06490 [Gammaproteobacteria bacterium]|jgi:hypothetical protein|nr:hypothetical protein [Gammaproteobacteria bacterium]